MQLVCVDPRTDRLWQRVVDQHNSSVFHSPRWMRVLADTYDMEVGAYAVLDDMGNPCAGLPFCRIRDMIGERVVALPFSDYCDPLANDWDKWSWLSEKLVTEACPVIVRCLHNSLPLSDERFQLLKQAKWHGMDLQPDLDTLWNGLDDSARRAIKKAERDGVVVKVAERKEELRAFFEVHLRTRKYKYRLLTQPYQFFENIWRHFVEDPNGMLIIAVYQGNIIGGVMFLEWKDKLFYKFNASIPADLSHRPNDLLIWEGIKYGRAKGLTHLDFGLSDLGQDGLVRYKRKFATEEKVISFLQHVPAQAPPEPEKQIRGLLPNLTALFTDGSVPDTITEKAGEILYRFFT
jgi:CelD/BcsL family acetyltransferase involved in cellulose biosynthesis